MQTRRYFLAGAALCVVGVSFPALAQTANGLTTEQRLELRQRLQNAKTEEERRQIRREYLEQLRTGGGQQTQGGDAAQPDSVEGLTSKEKSEMRQRLRSAKTEQEREQILQEYRDRAHLRGQGAQKSGGRGKGGSGQQGKQNGQDGEQPLLYPQGKRGGKN